MQIHPTVDGGWHLLSVLLVGEDDRALIEIPAAEVDAFAAHLLA